MAEITNDRDSGDPEMKITPLKGQIVDARMFRRWNRVTETQTCVAATTRLPSSSFFSAPTILLWTDFGRLSGRQIRIRGVLIVIKPTPRNNSSSSNTRRPQHSLFYSVIDCYVRSYHSNSSRDTIPPDI